MTFAKCRFYELDGTPINGGCRRVNTGACDFVHPSHPDWAKARDPKPWTGGSGGRVSGSGNVSSSSAGWAAASSSTASAWSSSSPAPGSSWVEAPKADASKNSGWGDSGGRGWGDVLNPKDNDTSGWGSSTFADGWGDSTSRDTNKGGGSWGDASKMKDNETSSQGGWGPSDHSATKDDESGKEENTGGWGSSDTKNKGGNASEGSGWGTKNRHGQSSNEINPALARNVTPRSHLEDVDMQDVQTLSATSHPSVVKPILPTGADTTITRMENSRFRAKEPVGPSERRDAWEVHVKTFSEAIRAYGAKIDAEKRRDCYKRLQNSSQFARVGTRGRQMLDDNRKEIEETIMRCSKELKCLMESLAQLPEMSNKFLDISKVDEQEIISYVAEVKEWIESTRPLVLKLTAVGPPLAPDSSPIKDQGRSLLDDGQIDDAHPSPAKRNRPSPEYFSASDISARLSRAHDLIEDKHNNLNRRVPSAEISRMVQETVDNIWAVKMGNAASSKPTHQLSNEVHELGNQVTRGAEDTASALTLQLEKDQQLTAMREEHQKLLQQQAQSQQEEADIQKKLDANSAFLKQIEDQMRQLLAQRQAPHHLHFAEDTRSQIGEIAKQTITEEVEPAIINFKLAVEGHINGQHGQIYQMLWERLEPSLVLTERIYQWLNSQIQKQM